MEKEEIIAGNKLMAEFLGYKYFPHTEAKFGAGWKLSDSKPVKELRHLLPIGNIVFLGRRHGDLRFFNSWDWLMMVIKKIESIDEDCIAGLDRRNFHVHITKRHTRIIYDWNTYFMMKPTNTKEMELFSAASKDYRYSLFDNNKLKATFFAVVDFIKWYNEAERVGGAL